MESAGHAQPSSTSLQDLIKAALQARSKIMFSGETGAVVASGEPAATSAPSLKLYKDVIDVVQGLPDELFDRYAPHRPCGLLDRAGATGMLIADVLGSPLLPWVLAEPIGKAVARRANTIAEVKKKAKKKAKRKKADAEAAASAAVCRRVELALPSPTAIPPRSDRSGASRPSF